MENLQGFKFGRLTVLKSFSKNKRGYSECMCECGNVFTTRNDLLKNGRSVSCGCYNRDRAKRGDNNRKHGKHGTRIYRIWQAMINRCRNKNQPSYKNYGGRGITVCSEWLNDFQTFCDWSVCNGYAENLTIDRIDVNGNYEPSNCRWITREEQANNKRNNHLIIYNGETHNIKQWAEITGISQKKIQWRLSHGWDVERTLEVKK